MDPSPRKITKYLRNRTMARRALVNAYRANKTASGEDVYKKAVNRINRVVKNKTRRENVKRQLPYAANANNLVKVHGINKNHARKITLPIIARQIKQLKNELLAMNVMNILRRRV